MFSQLDQAVFFMPCLPARGPVGLARRIIARFHSLSQTLALRVAGFGLVVSDLLRCSQTDRACQVGRRCKNEGSSILCSRRKCA